MRGCAGISEMARLFGFSRTHGFPTALYVAILKVLSSLMRMTEGLVSYGQIMLGRSKPCGTGCDLYPAPKRFKYTSGRLCGTAFPQKHSLHLGAIMWTHSTPIAKLLKPLFTFFETALRREKSGAKLQEYCPYPSLLCLCKTGYNLMPLRRGLLYLISSLGESSSLSLARNFGSPIMRESLITNQSPNIPFYTHRCRQLPNSIFWQELST